MRLIDADALKKKITTVEDKAKYKALQYSGVDFESWKMSITVTATFEQCKGYISDAPTVDAIPVEWLQTHITTIEQQRLLDEWAERRDDGEN